MPSYRLVLTVANILAPIPPENVLPQCADMLRQYVNVESFDLRINRGAPQIVLRYTAPDKTEATHAAVQAVNKISGLIEVTKADTLQRVHGRWSSLQVPWVRLMNVNNRT